jgi:hypothetical protein
MHLQGGGDVDMLGNLPVRNRVGEDGLGHFISLRHFGRVHQCECRCRGLRHVDAAGETEALEDQFEDGIGEKAAVERRHGELAGPGRWLPAVGRGRCAEADAGSPRGRQKRK